MWLSVLSITLLISSRAGGYNIIILETRAEFGEPYALHQVEAGLRGSLICTRVDIILSDNRISLEATVRYVHS